MPNRTEQNPKGGRRLNLWSLPPLLFPNSPVIVFYIIALLSISTGRSNNKLPPPKTPLLPRGVGLLVGGGDTSLLQGVNFLFILNWALKNLLMVNRMILTKRMLPFWGTPLTFCVLGCVVAGFSCCAAWNRLTPPVKATPTHPVRAPFCHC